MTRLARKATAFIDEADIESKMARLNNLISLWPGGPMAGSESGKRNCDPQGRDNNEQRNVGRDGEILRENHFQADEAKDDSESVAQIDKTIHQVREQEVERTQTKDGANVRGVNDEGISCDREDGRNGIDRED